MAIDDGVNQAGLDAPAEKDFKKTEDIINEKMKLICECVDDYRRAALDDMAALVAIGIIIKAHNPDPEALAWARATFMEDGCDCGSFEGDCHNC